MKRGENMRIFYRILFILLFFLFTFIPVFSQNINESPKDLKIKFDLSARVLVGEKVEMKVIIKNISKGNILLESMYVPEMPDAYNVWPESLYGDLTYEPEKDVYIHNTMTQMATSASFYTILLAPGEYTEGSLELYFLDTGEVSSKVMINYYKLTDKQAAKFTYYPMEANNFEEKYGPSYLFDKDTPHLLTSSNFYFIFRKTDEIKLKTLGASFSLSVVPRGYSIDDAFEKIGIETEEYYYSQWKNAWVVYDGKYLWILNKNIEEKYKGVNLDIFKFIEKQTETVYFIAWEGENTNPYKKAQIENLVEDYGGEKFLCYHLDVPKEKALDLIQDLSESGISAEMSNFQLVPAIGVFY